MLTRRTWLSNEGPIDLSELQTVKLRRAADDT